MSLRTTLKDNRILVFSLIATVMAMTVVMLGAYTRLKNAGLGCPDWPTCYGQILVPQSAEALANAQAQYPSATINPAKAWPEMIHRYFAGSLGLIILGLAIASLIKRRTNPKQAIIMPLLIVALVIFQAILGMWTVTWLLHPVVVMGHLLGGMSIAASLWWVSLRNMSLTPAKYLSRSGLWSLRIMTVLGLIIAYGQIFLGGWTSANYASIVCEHFPYCHDSFFPSFDFANAFQFTRPIGTNYEGGVLSETAKVTIQMMHRYGAIFTASYMVMLGFVLTRLSRHPRLRHIGWALLSVIIVQFFLGIANIDSHLALGIAVLHNSGALLLLLTLVALCHALFYGGVHERNLA